MSLLDEIRLKATDKIQQEEQARQRQEKLHAMYLTEINPRLQTIYNYLSELFQHLNLIKPEVDAKYSLPVLGEIKGLRQADYSIRADSLTEMKEIRVQFLCARPEKLAVTVTNGKDFDLLTEFLLKHDIEHITRKTIDDRHAVSRAEFLIENQIIATMLFTPDVESSTIRLTERHFDGFGIRKLTIRPNEVNEQLLDNFGRYILRQQNSFLKLDISEQERERIRQRLLEERRALEETVRAAEALEQQHAELVKDSRWRTFFRKSG